MFLVFPECLQGEIDVSEGSELYFARCSRVFRVLERSTLCFKSPLGS